MIGVVVRGAECATVRELFELFKTPWEFWRSDRQYDVIVQTDDSVERPLAKLVILYGAKDGGHDREGDRAPGWAVTGAMLLWDGDRIPIYGHCTAFADDGYGAELVLADSGEPAVSVTPEDGRTVVRVGYDLFGEVKILLSVGQPAVHAGIATLEKHIAYLRHVIVSHGVSLIEIPPVPQGYRFIVCLTHDVDHPAIRLHRFDHTMFGFLYRALVRSVASVLSGRARLVTLWHNWMAVLKLPFVHLGVAKDFWSQFERYLEIERGLASTFFVIPFRGKPGRTSDGPAPAIRAASYGAGDIGESLRGLRAAGREVGLHGIDAWLDSASGVTERDQVSAASGSGVKGVRMHWLYFDEHAPERLDAAGFTYDSTVGYNETVGFRAGTMQAFRPLTARTLLELPMAIMDTALFYPAHLGLTPMAAREAVWRLLDEAECYGGALTINWHDRSLAPERLWGDFYVELVDELRRRGAWFATAAQAVAWFSQRRAVSVSSIRWTGESAHVEVGGDRMADLPGLTVRVHASGTLATKPISGHSAARCVDMAAADALAATGSRS